MKRTLTGTFALKDSVSSTGEEIRSVENNVNTEIIQLKGRSAVLRRSVDEVSVRLTDLATSTEAQFKITANQISSEVTRATTAEEQLSSSITQNAEQIKLKVSIGNVTEQLNSELTITGNSIALKTGNFTIDSDNLSFDNAGNATFSGDVTGATINGSKFRSDTFYADDEEVIIGDFYVSVDETYRFASIDESIVFNTADDPGGNSFASLTIGFEGNQVYLGHGTGRFDQTVYADTFYGEGTTTSSMYDLRLRKSWWEGCTITERVQFLSDCIWELAGIIDRQWSDYDSIYDALDNYYEDNKPW